MAQHMANQVITLQLTALNDRHWAFLVRLSSMQISIKLPFQRKQVDDVLAQEEQWANAQKTEGASDAGPQMLTAYSFMYLTTPARKNTLQKRVPTFAFLTWPCSRKARNLCS
jgi:hypothetical protein